MGHDLATDDASTSGRRRPGLADAQPAAPPHSMQRDIARRAAQQLDARVGSVCPCGDDTGCSPVFDLARAVLAPRGPRPGPTVIPHRSGIPTGSASDVHSERISPHPPADRKRDCSVIATLSATLPS